MVASYKRFQGQEKYQTELKRHKFFLEKNWILKVLQIKTLWSNIIILRINFSKSSHRETILLDNVQKQI